MDRVDGVAEQTGRFNRILGVPRETPGPEKKGEADRRITRGRTRNRTRAGATCRNGLPSISLHNSTTKSKTKPNHGSVDLPILNGDRFGSRRE